MSTSLGSLCLNPWVLYQRVASWIRLQTDETKRVLQRLSSNDCSDRARLPSPEEHPAWWLPRGWGKRTQCLLSSSSRSQCPCVPRAASLGKGKSLWVSTPAALSVWTAQRAPTSTSLQVQLPLPLLGPSSADLGFCSWLSTFTLSWSFQGSLLFARVSGAFPGNVSIQWPEIRPGASCGFP